MSDAQTARPSSWWVKLSREDFMREANARKATMTARTEPPRFAMHLQRKKPEGDRASVRSEREE